MELRETDIRTHYPAALAMLEGFDHTPRIASARTRPEPERSTGLGSRRKFRSTTPGLVTRSTARPEGVRLVERIQSAEGGDGLVSPLQATVCQCLRRSISIALAVGEAFSGATGLDALKRENLEGRLGQARSMEFSELLTAEALAVLHTFANATTYILSTSASEAAVEVGGVDEILTDNAHLGLHGALWELDQVLERFVDSEEALVATCLAYAEMLMEKVALRARTAPRLEAFADATYRVEADNFLIQGFAPSRRARGTSLSMQFKKPEEVIGNHIAKHQAMRLARMLMAYDFGRKLNPFAELGGFIFTFMGDGQPGTGKTTLIQMMAGLIHGYCETAGYPFRYRNFSIDQIDSYQGKSGRNARAFVNDILDPNVIGFGTLDDIDQIAGKRSDSRSSTGQQEVTAVLMEAFAGAGTVVRGNCTFGMFSNYPENVDDALRQRAGTRFLVDGPQTREDYIDILHLLLGGNHGIPLGDHDPYSTQEIRKAVTQSFQRHERPQEDTLRRVWESVKSEGGTLDTVASLGRYLKAIQLVDQRFTGRAVKNITDAVKVRAMDFDMPDEWVEEPELFLFRPYGEKLAMIDELRRPITVEMVIQEINRYADSEFRYSEASDEAAISAAVREMGRMEEARRRHSERRS